MENPSQSQEIDAGSRSRGLWPTSYCAGRPTLMAHTGCSLQRGKSSAIEAEPDTSPLRRDHRLSPRSLLCVLGRLSDPRPPAVMEARRRMGHPRSRPFSASSSRCPIGEVLGNKVVDQEVVMRTFPDGTGHIDGIAIYEVKGDKIANAWFILGSPVLDRKP
jgi:hypothetical protein